MSESTGWRLFIRLKGGKGLESVESGEVDAWGRFPRSLGFEGRILNFGMGEMISAQAESIEIGANLLKLAGCFVDRRAERSGLHDDGVDDRVGVADAIGFHVFSVVDG